MKALTYHGQRDVRYESVDDPTLPDARGAIISTEQTAICGSDLHGYHGPTTEARIGATLGHESIGEVVEVGGEVRRFRVGDRVLISAAIGCGECPPCLRGKVGACEQHMTRIFGAGLGGCQAQAIAVPVADHALLRIPEGVSDEQALLLTDILPTGYYGASNADIRPGQSVAVIGLGPVGQLAVETAMLFGPASVFAIDQVPDRLDAAARLGAIPVNAREVDPVEFVRDHTGGLGPHAVIEAAGPDETVQMSFQMVRGGGVVSQVGVNMNPAFPMNMGMNLMKDITYRVGVCPIPMLWDDLIPLLQEGRLHPERIFTHRLPMSEGGKAYDLFDRRTDGVIKVLLDATA